MAYSAMPSIAAHVKAGRVKVLAVSTPKRSPTALDVPTVAELGVPGNIGLVAPTGTPTAIIARISQEIAKAVRSPEVAQRFAQLDIKPVGSTPEEYGARIRAASQKYAQAVRVSGARID